MISRPILRAAAEGPFDGPAADARGRDWGRNFAPNAVRRMTRLGLMLGEVLRDFRLNAEDSVIYATTFGETITLARYLESFPTASPLFFQTSIHPSAIEQVLINRTRPVRELSPLAGQGDLSAQAALTALLTPADHVVLAGGEEVGSWMRDLDAASNVGFAFALELGANGEDGTGGSAIGELSWVEGEDSSLAGFGSVATRGTASAVAGDLLVLFEAVRNRAAMRCPAPNGGEVRLRWY